MGLATEMGELLEVFQWLTEEQSQAIVHSADDLRRREQRAAEGSRS
jgi:hypothetical protein